MATPRKPTAPPPDPEPTPPVEPPSGVMITVGAERLMAGGNLNKAAALFREKALGKSLSATKVPIIGIDHQAGAFVLPSGEVTERVGGYPVFITQSRRLYLKPPAPGSKGVPPDCWSPDMVKPHPSSKVKQADLCANCPKSLFGSARDERGQACAVQSWVFLLNADFGIPPIAVLVAPPSSIRILFGNTFKGGFFSTAVARHGAYEIVWTWFSLVPEEGQVRFCRLRPEMGPVLTEDAQVLKVVELRNNFLKAMEAMRGETPEIEANEREGG